jgi:NADH:ubiquinone oxidoreductase subunit 5 (subunit L)/multisubunit Na+/H+ antiporter MnhA subunit
MTHAFFKALLFLGAGSVIHACSGEQDMRHMGGLRKYTPITMVTLLCGSLAIAGFPFLSGAASKDLILEAAYEHAPWMYWVGVFTAGMTAFYVFRAFFLTFFGEYKGKPATAMATVTDHMATLHESPGDVDPSSPSSGRTQRRRWIHQHPALPGALFPLQEGEPALAGICRHAAGLGESPWRICST